MLLTLLLRRLVVTSESDVHQLQLYDRARQLSPTCLPDVLWLSTTTDTGI